MAQQWTMRQRKQLMYGVVIGAFFGPLVMTCSSDVARRSFRGGGNLMRDAGRVLQDVGQALLTDAGEALVDGGASLQDTGQALSDASGSIGDGSMIRDATAQTNSGGAACYVAWGTATRLVGCGANFTEMYSGRAMVPFLRGGAGTRAFAAWSVSGSNVPLAAFGSTMCAAIDDNAAMDLDTRGTVGFAAGTKWTSAVHCAVCCR